MKTKKGAVKEIDKTLEEFKYDNGEASRYKTLALSKRELRRIQLALEVLKQAERYRNDTVVADLVSIAKQELKRK